MAQELGKLDLDLIGLLRQDSRLPAAVLAKRLGVSRSTVQNRINRLRRDGVLTGFTVTLRSDSPETGVRAITQIEIHGGASDQVIAALKRLPEVHAVYSTNGRWDLVAELHAADLVSFDQALRRLRGVKGIATSETSLLLAKQ